MPTIPINITGGSYKSRARALSKQVTKNFYPEVVDNPSAKSQLVLHSFPGLTLFGTAAGVNRGMFVHLGVLYKVTHTTLYSVNSIGVHTSLGTIPGSGRCIFDGIGSNVVITNGDGKVYQYNGSTVTEITDPDLESPTSVDHLNNQIIYNGNGGRFATSDVGDATSIDALNYATAESDADDLVRPYVFNERVYLFGDEVTEVWYNSGVGSPPFDRIDGASIPIGLMARHSVSNNDKYMYFLGDDNEVYAVQGANATKVSDVSISRQIASYSVVSDANGWCFSMEGKNFYVLTFPSANKSFCYSEGLFWFELSSGITDGRWRADSYAYAYRKHLVADYQNGNIYVLDIDAYTENGSVIERIRDTGPLHGGQIGAPGKKIEMDRFELIMETGVGLISGQGSDPVVMLQVSDDGGDTFSTEMWGKVGKMNKYTIVEWHALGSFYERIIRVKTSDPVFYSIHSAAADLRVGI